MTRHALKIKAYFNLVLFTDPVDNFEMLSNIQDFDEREGMLEELREDELWKEEEEVSDSNEIETEALLNLFFQRKNKWKG